MKLTPLDIKKQEFKKSLRGFDPIEVETFLEMVSEEYESLIREKNSLADEVLKLKTQLNDYQNVEKTLQETLVSAQQTINDSKENSEREAESIIREAQLNSEKIMQETKLKLAELKNDLVLVKAQKESFARRLKHLLESQLDLIEVLELDDLGFEQIESKRMIRRKPSKPEQEEIEFEGVDEVLPNEPGGKTNVMENVSEVNENSVTWANEEKQDIHEPHSDEKQEKKSRISDQLIF